MPATGLELRATEIATVEQRWRTADRRVRVLAT
jgi:hypothetical protein